MTGPYSAEEDETLRRMWTLGNTTPEIGRELRRTKNSVIGRARRLGCPPRPSPIKVGRQRSLGWSSPITARSWRTVKQVNEQQARERKAALEKPRAVKTFFPTTWGCQWIEDEPTADAQKCGHQRVNGSAYCADHHVRCWLPKPKKGAKAGQPAADLG